MRVRSVLLAGTLFCGGFALAAPPEDPAARKIYDHNYKWLANSQPSFIAINMRGANDSQYPERRQAAFDLLREKHDLTVVPELMDELSRGSFLSGQICELLGEWNAKKSLPLLKKVAADSKRPPEVRRQAEKAIYLLKITAPPPGPPSY